MRSASVFLIKPKAEDRKDEVVEVGDGQRDDTREIERKSEATRAWHSEPSNGVNCPVLCHLLLQL